MRVAPLATIAACALLLGTVPARLPASAQNAPQGRDAAVSRGQEFYAVACADCHGMAGRGAGPMAPLLVTAPPDLTVLRQRNDGVFPFRHVFDVVDGRTLVPSHGSRPGMPLWGSVFQDFARERFGPYGTETYVRGRLVELVLYLETIQQ